MHWRFKPDFLTISLQTRSDRAAQWAFYLFDYIGGWQEPNTEVGDSRDVGGIEPKDGHEQQGRPRPATPRNHPRQPARRRRRIPAHLVDSHPEADTQSAAHWMQSPGHACRGLSTRDYNETLVFLESRKLFPENIEEGMVFEGLPAGCNTEAPKNQLFFVSDIYPEHVVLDGNHPLAGIAIRIHAKIESIREATVSEIGAGTLGTGFLKLAEPPAATPHVHGPDSNHLH